MSDFHWIILWRPSEVLGKQTKYLGLDLKAVQNAEGKIDESKITIEKEEALYVFGSKGEQLPANAIKGFEILERTFNNAVGKWV